MTCRCRFNYTRRCRIHTRSTADCFHKASPSLGLQPAPPPRAFSNSPLDNRVGDFPRSPQNHYHYKLVFVVSSLGLVLNHHHSIFSAAFLFMKLFFITVCSSRKKLRILMSITSPHVPVHAVIINRFPRRGGAIQPHPRARGGGIIEMGLSMARCNQGRRKIPLPDVTIAVMHPSATGLGTGLHWSTTDVKRKCTCVSANAWCRNRTDSTCCVADASP